MDNLTNEKYSILIYLFQFRFLTRDLISRLLKHKNRSYSQTLLKELLDVGYIKRRYIRVENNSMSPAIYFIGNKGRKILLENNITTPDRLEYVYKEKNISKSFHKKSFALCEYYLSLVTKFNDKFTYLSKNELYIFEYLPSDIPDAYVSLVINQIPVRFFVYIFQSGIPVEKLDKLFEEIKNHFYSDVWDENAGKPYPSCIFVLPSYYVRKQVTQESKQLTNFPIPYTLLLTSELLK